VPRARQGALFLMLLALASCEPAPPKPQRGAIVVKEFEVGPSATSISRYSDPVDKLGFIAASTIARLLKARGFDAVAVSRDSPESAGQIVTGRITRIDGGSRGARVAASMTIGFGFTSYGIGGSTCSIEAELRNAESNSVLGTYRQEMLKHGTGWFWIRFGESSERQIRACVNRIASNIAVAVDSGQYRGGLTGGPPVGQPIAAPAVQTAPSSGARTIADRLRELNHLRDTGIITDREYEERRRSIVGEL
jgi:uncharacterized protein DUF4410